MAVFVRTSGRTFRNAYKADYADRNAVIARRSGAVKGDRIDIKSQ